LGGLFAGLLASGSLHAAGTVPVGEEALFTNSVAPDALIVLDLSGSMLLPPPGDELWIASSATCQGSGVAHYAASGAGHTKACSFSAYDGNSVPRYSNASCTGPFYTSSQTGYTTDCRRVNIARRALFDMLDDNDDNTVNSTDETSLGVRIGYMRFTDGNDTSGDYSAGNNKLIRAIGSKYSLIYCAGNSSCTLSSTTSSASIIDSDDWPNSGTPLVYSLNEARLYLNVDKAADDAGACRQKFVILVSDGADTYSCSGSGTETQSDQYKRRRESVAKAKALRDAGYRVFVVGFGAGMPANLQNTLNWMAYYGGTDNPNASNSGSTSAYSIATCNRGTSVTGCCPDTAAACYPSGVTGCGEDTATGTCPDCFATSNDPGNTALSGYAFLASDADQLANSLKAAINIVREAPYSFSQSSLQSSRTRTRTIYEGCSSRSATILLVRTLQEIPDLRRRLRGDATVGCGRTPPGPDRWGNHPADDPDVQGRRDDGLHNNEHHRGGSRRLHDHGTGQHRRLFPRHVHPGQLEAGRRLPRHPHHRGDAFSVLRRHAGSQWSAERSERLRHAPYEPHAILHGHEPETDRAGGRQ